MSENYSFGSWVRRCRKALDWTQADLAEQVGCGLSMIRKIESDVRRPSRQIAALLAARLQIPPEEQAAFMQAARGAGADHVAAQAIPAPPAPRGRLGPTNLPLQLASFVGRRPELAELGRLLDSHRLITLTGVGGTGKTRLALQVAGGAIERFKDGVWLIELADIHDPALVVPRIAAVLGIREEEHRSLTNTLVEALAARQMLFVLDNCEHLIRACAMFVSTVAQYAAEVRFLATSREPLGLRGEQCYPVAPLALPQPEADLAQLHANEAVALFLDRAQGLQPTFAITPEQLPVIAEICRRVDGLPLAIELAAARTRLLPPSLLLERLTTSLMQLASARHDMPARHQTLRSVMTWSYDLLSEAERQVFRWLGAFEGGWTLEAAEAVCAWGTIGASEVLDILGHLVDKSLVTLDQTGDGLAAPRYRMLATLRQYSQEQAAALGEERMIRTRHAAFFRALAETAEARLRGPDQVRWLKILEDEDENLRAALEWALQNDDQALALRLSGSLWWFWYLRSYWSQGRDWLERVLGRQQPGAADSLPGTAGAAERDRAKALLGAGSLAFCQGDSGAARSWLEESLRRWQEAGDQPGAASTLIYLGLQAMRESRFEQALANFSASQRIYQELADEWGVAYALYNQGLLWRRQGKDAEALRCLEDGLRRWRAIGDGWGIATALNPLASIASRQQEYQQAGAMLQESLAFYRQLKDNYGIAYTLSSLGDLARLQGDSRAATAYYKEGLSLFEQLGDQASRGMALHNLGYAAIALADAAEATRCFKESLSLNAAIGRKAGVAECLAGLGAAEALGGLASADERPLLRAARLFGAAETLLQAIHASLMAADQQACAEQQRAVQARLGAERFEQAWRAGQAMTTDQAIAYAHEDREALAVRD